MLRAIAVFPGTMSIPFEFQVLLHPGATLWHNSSSYMGCQPGI